MNVSVIFDNWEFFDDVDNDSLNFFGFFGLIMCSMKSSLCTKKLNVKMHYMVVNYKFKAMLDSINISNARALRYNNGPCCNLHSLSNGQCTPTLSIPKKISKHTLMLKTKFRHG